MVSERLLRRFDCRSRLLFRALLPGVSGSGDALRLFHRQRRCDPGFSLRPCLEALLQDELCEDEVPGQLKLTPVVCQLPVSLQRGLLSFLHLTASLHPPTFLLDLIRCLTDSPCQDPWVRALVAQLHRDLEPDALAGTELVSLQCKTRLQELCRKLGGSAACGPTSLMAPFQSEAPAEPSQSPPSGLSLQLSPQPQEHSKRKSDTAGLEQDCEGGGSQSKRRRLEDGGDGEQLPLEITVNHLAASLQALENISSEQPLHPCAELPEHIQAAVPRIRELLDAGTEWDHDSSSVLQVLNKCDPSQVELLCGALRLSEVPEPVLPQLCTAVLALSPELSHSAAAALLRSLFLGRVLSLLDPPSRCLVSTMVSLCGRYPRAACSTLLGPALQAGRLNAVQAELLCRLTGDALEPQHQLLIFGEALSVPWSEELLTVIHTLLGSLLELSEELFSQLVSSTCHQAPRFSTSVKFARMVLTILTKYQRQVSPAHKRTFSCCLTSHESFLKKALLAALKKLDAS
ncbi:hypothetical protein Z043-119884 [Arapaima gigas]